MKNSKSLISIILSLAVMLSLFCMTTVIQTQAAGTTYYVDSTSGSDSNNGTSATSAWKSLDKVNATTFSAGSKILFKCGGSWSGVLNPKGSGNASAYNEISSYGDEDLGAPIISNAGANKTAQGINAAFVLHNQDYWKISKLELVNENSTSAKHVVYLSAKDGYRSNHITVSDCIIHGTSNSWKDTSSSGKGLNGITISHNNSYWGFHDDITIENNTIFDCNGDGILELGSWCGSTSDGRAEGNSDKNIVIRGNYLKHIGRDGILVNNCNAPLVEYNVVDDSHSSTNSSYHVAIWPFASYNALFQYNEAFNTKTTKDGQGFDCDYQCYGTTFQYNYGHDNQGGFMLICCEPSFNNGQAWNKDITVRYNIGENNSNVQFAFTGQVENTNIYNNTLYYRSGNTVSTYLRDTSKMPNNTYFTNNIFYNVNGGGYKLSYNGVSCRNTVWKNNLFYGIHPSDEPTDTGKITSDPKFINAGGAGEGFGSCQVYYLKAGSPALDAGVAVSNPSVYPCTTDFFGNTLDSTPNIGAYGGEGYDGVTVTTVKDYNTTRATIKTVVKPTTTRPTAATPTQPEYDGAETLESIVCRWNGQYWFSSKNSGASGYDSSDYMYIDCDSSVSTDCFQLGTWSGGGFSSSEFSNASNYVGIAARVKIDRASVSSLNAVVKLFISGDSTAYNCTYVGVPTNGQEVVCFFPFANFRYGNDPSMPLSLSDLRNVTNLEFDIAGDAPFNNLKFSVSPLYVYDIDESKLPSTTEVPTTQAPTTEEPTTQQPTVPTAATQTPIDTPLPTPAAAKPAKVKKLKVKTAGKKKVKVRWKKAKYATKYIVKYSYKKNMKGAKFKTVKKLKVTLKKLKSGKRVYVRVRAVNGTVKGKFSVRKSVKVK